MTITDIDKQLDKDIKKYQDIFISEFEAKLYKLVAQAKAEQREEMRKEGFENAVSSLLRYSGPIDNVEEFVREDMVYDQEKPVFVDDNELNTKTCVNPRKDIKIKMVIFEIMDKFTNPDSDGEPRWKVTATPKNVASFLLDRLK